MKIVLGVDSGRVYQEATSLLARLKFEHASVIPINVSEPIPADAYGEGVLAPILAVEELRLSESKKYLGEAAELISPAMSEEKIPGIGVIGFPGEELMGLAEKEKAGLIAIGSRRLGKVRDFFAGSVGRALTIGSDISFLVARSGMEDEKEVTAVFATDHSEYADRCLEELLRLNPVGLTKLHLVFAADTNADVRLALDYTDGGIAESTEEVNADIQTIGLGLVSRCEETGRFADYHLVRQTPYEGIRHRMNATKADMLIVGAERHGVLERLIVGSVALHEVVAEEFSVLVIRVPQEAAK